jgi:hypothetical protein
VLGDMEAYHMGLRVTLTVSEVSAETLWECQMACPLANGTLSFLFQGCRWDLSHGKLFGAEALHVSQI